MSRPIIKTLSSAGADLTARDNEVLEPGEIKAISTGYFYDVDVHGRVGLVRGRSSFAFAHNVWSFEGTIDSDYTGEIKILLENKGDKMFFINKGDRIGQLVVVPHCTDLYFDTENKVREGGFGSTDNE